MYQLVYYLHVLTVCLSGSFFLLRGIWMLQDSDLLARKLVRVAPHINDSILLLAALYLALAIEQYPITHAWLTVKVLALLAYIILGVFALRRGRTKSIRVLCFIGALAAFGFMVSVALTRDPLGVFSLLS